MTTAEILNKVAELKAIAAQAQALATELNIELASKMDEAEIAVDAYMSSVEVIDKEQFKALSLEANKVSEMQGLMETVVYKLNKEVVENLNKIAK